MKEPAPLIGDLIRGPQGAPVRGVVALLGAVVMLLAASVTTATAAPSECGPPGVLPVEAPCRAYELVSPADSLPYSVSTSPWLLGGAKPRHAQSWIARTNRAGSAHIVMPKRNKLGIPGVAPDGDAAEYLLARRTDDAGWSWAAPIADRTDCDSNRENKFSGMSESGRYALVGFMCESERAIFSPRDPVTGERHDQTQAQSTIDFTTSASMYRVDYTTGQTAYVTGKYGADGTMIPRTDSYENYVIGYSADMTDVYFATGAGLVEGVDDDASGSLYVYRHKVGAGTELLARTTSGAPFKIVSSVTPSPLDRPGALARGTAGNILGMTVTAGGEVPLDTADIDAVSDVYWISQDGAVTWVSRPHPDSTESPLARAFEGASSNGRKIVFSSLERMLGEDTDNRRDLYLYDFDKTPGARVSRVSVIDEACNALDCDDNASTTSAARHADANFSTMSADGSSVFFVTGDRLALEDVDETQSLYVRDVENGRTLYVAPAGANRTTASNGDDAGTTGFSGSLVGRGTLGSGGGAMGSRPIEVSENGATAAFWIASNVSLPSERGGSDGDGVRDLYLWNRDVGLRRVREGLSADANGNAPARTAGPGCIYSGAASGAPGTRGPCRGVSADGSVVVMSSDYDLVQSDTDGGARDVYMLDVRNGELELISPPGFNSAPSSLLDMSANGDSVFFTTNESLDQSGDRDGGLPDVYVSRVGGGLEPEDASDGQECGGDACQRVAAPPARVATRTIDTGAVPDALDRRVEISGLRLPARQRRSLAQRGSGVVRIRATGAGVVRVVLKARNRGRLEVMARVRRSIDRAGTVSIRMSLRQWARRQLRRNGKLRVEMNVRVSDSITRTQRIVLRRAS